MRPEVSPERDSVNRLPTPEPDRDLYLPGRLVCPGIYAGRIGDRVKIGCSLNLRQRVDAFRFDELIAVLPVNVPRNPSENDRAYAYRVRDALRDLEGRLHAALAEQRVCRLSRANANEWFRLDDRVLAVLFEAGAIVARARVAGRPLGTRTGKPGWPLQTDPAPHTANGMIGMIAQLKRVAEALPALTDAGRARAGERSARELQETIAHLARLAGVSA